jgi:probable rRNA maturation factor
MDSSHTRGPAQAGIPAQPSEIIVTDPAWRRAIRAPDRIARRAAAAAGTAATVTLASDRDVKHLNAQYRGKNKPTNVLTFEPPAPGTTGDIILALGTVLREAHAAGRRPAAHLAHLVIHGALHLRGFDHSHPGDARRMEMAESRILAGLGVGNPWKGGRW